MVLILALTGYLTPPAASIPWGTAYLCYAQLFLAGHGPLAPPHLVSGSLSRIIRVETLRFRIPHFYCFVLSWGRASFLVWHFACCQHNNVRNSFRVHPFSGHHPYPYASCGGKWGAHHTRWHGSKLCFQLGWCVVYCLPARAYTRVYHFFQVFTPYFQGSGFSGRVHFATVRPLSFCCLIQFSLFSCSVFVVVSSILAFFCFIVRSHLFLLQHWRS